MPDPSSATATSQPLPVFDGHNDVLTRLYQLSSTDPVDAFLQGRTLAKQTDSSQAEGHLDYPRMQAGGFAGGLFALFVPPSAIGPSNFSFDSMGSDGYRLAFPPPISTADALPVVFEQIAILLRIIEQAAGRIKLCTQVEHIRQCVSDDKLAVVLHMEGAEAIDADLHTLDVLHAAGLKSLGPVWSRKTTFAEGVPFGFPASPDTGAGLTEHGKALVKRCNALGILIDLSHINERGFWDVAALSNKPLIATHSNAHALCLSTRNLTDKQLAAIKESDGMVGVNLATCFLRADGAMKADTPIDAVLQHMDYLIEHLGESRVGLGSDFDGAIIPASIGDVQGLPVLHDAMRRHGYPHDLIESLLMHNWIAALERTWC